jgi:hypothetical protein
MLNRFVLISCFLLATAAPTLAGDPPKPSAPQKTPQKTMTLSGCVADQGTAENGFMLWDSTDNTTYRLTGKDMHTYANRRVQIVGGVVQPKLKIVGGLVPTPNVAAQAGAVDPAKAANAGSGATGAGIPTPVQEFRVKSVRTLSGSCPQR